MTIQTLHNKIDTNDLKGIKKSGKNQGLLSTHILTGIYRYLRNHPHFLGYIPANTSFSHSESEKSEYPILITEHKTHFFVGFVIYKELQKGAYGQVHLGQNISTNEWVAIKIQTLNSQEQNKIIDIEQENNTLQELGELKAKYTQTKSNNQSIFYSVMELGLGRSGTEVLFDESCFKKDKYNIAEPALDLTQRMERICLLTDFSHEVLREALELHLKGYINRDIKLVNFLFEEKTRTAKMIDQGFALKINELPQIYADYKQSKIAANFIKDFLAHVALNMPYDQDLTSKQLNALDENYIEIGLAQLESKKLTASLTEDEESVLNQSASTLQEYHRLRSLLSKGTFPYMAPESWNSNSFSVPSDVYATGVTLAEIFNARSLSPDGFYAYDLERGKEAKTQGEDTELTTFLSFGVYSPEISSYAPELSSIFNIITKMLNPDPRPRPALLECMNLISTIRAQLYVKQGLHAQAKLVETSQSLCQVFYALHQSISQVTDDKKKQVIIESIKMIKNFQRQIHMLSLEHPLTSEKIMQITQYTDDLLSKDLSLEAHKAIKEFQISLPSIYQFSSKTTSTLVSRHGITLKQKKENKFSTGFQQRPIPDPAGFTTTLPSSDKKALSPNNKSPNLTPQTSPTKKTRTSQDRSRPTSPLKNTVARQLTFAFSQLRLDSLNSTPINQNSPTEVKTRNRRKT
ncbi:MAG: protein kinase [Proteobacteria bacterium]|nr:protein kinase [Pseudomonadota bacterium]